MFVTYAFKIDNRKRTVRILSIFNFKVVFRRKKKSRWYQWSLNVFCILNFEIPFNYSFCLQFPFIWIVLFSTVSHSVLNYFKCFVFYFDFVFMHLVISASCYFLVVADIYLRFIFQALFDHLFSLESLICCVALWCLSWFWF